MFSCKNLNSQYAYKDVFFKLFETFFFTSDIFLNVSCFYMELYTIKILLSFTTKPHLTSTPHEYFLNVA